MTPIIEAIMKRRSVRSYDARPVSREIVDSIILAANEAPSGMNSQPWRFVIVEDKVFKKKLLDTAIPNSKLALEPLKQSAPERYASIMNRYAELEDPIYYGAPLIIFVIGRGKYGPDSCPMACQNIMLAAYSYGLGSIWVALGALVDDNPEIVKGLELEQGERIYGPILIGYPKVCPERPQKKEPAVKWI